MPKFVRKVCGVSQIMHKQEVRLCYTTQYWKMTGFSSDIKIHGERDYISSLAHWLFGIKTWITNCRIYTMTRLQRERESVRAKTIMQTDEIWTDRD